MVVNDGYVETSSYLMYFLQGSFAFDLALCVRPHGPENAEKVVRDNCNGGGSWAAMLDSLAFTVGRYHCESKLSAASFGYLGTCLETAVLTTPGDMPNNLVRLLATVCHERAQGVPPRGVWPTPSNASETVWPVAVGVTEVPSTVRRTSSTGSENPVAAWGVPPSSLVPQALQPPSALTSPPVRAPSAGRSDPRVVTAIESVLSHIRTHPDSVPNFLDNTSKGVQKQTNYVKSAVGWDVQLSQAQVDEIRAGVAASL